MVPERTQDVVCALIIGKSQPEEPAEQGAIRILCAQRRENAEHFPSLYEFPGGKVDGKESHLEALQRECMEELGVKIEFLMDAGMQSSNDHKNKVPQPCHSFQHAPKYDKSLDCIVIFRLFFYWARVVDQEPKVEPQALASQRIAFLTANQMTKLDFCPGDGPLIELLATGGLQPLLEL